MNKTTTEILNRTALKYYKEHCKPKKETNTKKGLIKNVAQTGIPVVR
ncbi:hypothetical protein [Crocosphaera sp.]|nr:hypothetical protein [Crocosphaera sp.]MDJ0579110.1 hypothetical protein [Crocosphaera sp.]